MPASSTMKPSRSIGYVGSSGRYAAPSSSVASTPTTISTPRGTAMPTRSPRPHAGGGQTAGEGVGLSGELGVGHRSRPNDRAGASGVRATWSWNNPSIVAVRSCSSAVSLRASRSAVSAGPSRGREPIVADGEAAPAASTAASCSAIRPRLSGPSASAASRTIESGATATRSSESAAAAPASAPSVDADRRREVVAAGARVATDRVAQQRLACARRARAPPRRAPRRHRTWPSAATSNVATPGRPSGAIEASVGAARVVRHLEGDDRRRS